MKLCFLQPQPLDGWVSSGIVKVAMGTLFHKLLDGRQLQVDMLFFVAYDHDAPVALHMNLYYSACSL